MFTHWGLDKMAAIFAEDIFEYIFLIDKDFTEINNILALVQIIRWRAII